MKKVLEFDTLTEAEFAAGLLRNREIVCEVRNAGNLDGGALDFAPFRAEVWVFRDEDLRDARAILEQPVTPTGTAWKCPTCGASIEPAFDACWSCGTMRP